MQHLKQTKKENYTHTNLHFLLHHEKNIVITINHIFIYEYK